MSKEIQKPKKMEETVWDLERDDRRDPTFTLYSRPIPEWNIRRNKRGHKINAKAYYWRCDNVEHRLPPTVIQLQPNQSVPHKINQGVNQQLLLHFTSGRSSHVIIDEIHQKIIVCEERLVRTSQHPNGAISERNWSAPTRTRFANSLTFSYFDFALETWTPQLAKPGQKPKLTQPDYFFDSALFSNQAKLAALVVVPVQDKDVDTSLIVALDEGKRGLFGLCQLSVPNHSEMADINSGILPKLHHDMRSAKLWDTELRPIPIPNDCKWPGTDWCYAMRQDYHDVNGGVVGVTDGWVWWHDDRVLVTTLHKMNKQNTKIEQSAIAIMRFAHKPVEPKSECQSDRNQLITKMTHFELIPLMLDNSRAGTYRMHRVLGIAKAPTELWPPCLIGRTGRALVFSTHSNQLNFIANKCLYQLGHEERKKNNTANNKKKPTEELWVYFSKELGPHTQSIQQHWMGAGTQLWCRMRMLDGEQVVLNTDREFVENTKILGRSTTR